MYGRTVHLAFRVYGLLVQPLYGFAVHPVRFECTTFLIFGRTARTLPRSISGSLWWARWTSPSSTPQPTSVIRHLLPCPWGRCFPPRSLR